MRRLAGIAVTLFVCSSAQTGVDRGGITLGVIESLNPLSVAGAEFESSLIQVTIDNTPATLSQLSSGELVTIVDGSYSVVLKSDFVIDGEIWGVDRGGINVLGQEVVLSNTDIEGNIVAVGQRVRVSGFTGKDTQHATHLALSSSVEDRVAGFVDDVDKERKRLEINDLLVDYSGAVISGIESDQLREDSRVMVSGAIVDNVLVATTLTAVPSFLDGVEIGTAVRIEGLVSDSEDDRFVVNNIVVNTSSAPNAPDGLEQGDRVVVDGSVQMSESKKVLLADRVSLMVIDGADDDGSDEDEQAVDETEGRPEHYDQD